MHIYMKKNFFKTTIIMADYSFFDVFQPQNGQKHINYKNPSSPSVFIMSPCLPSFLRGGLILMELIISIGWARLKLPVV